MGKKSLWSALLIFTLIFFGTGCNDERATIKSPVFGNEDASLKIALWFDFQCPACRTYETSIMRFVMDDYVKTGKGVSLTYRNMAFLGKESISAANAALCAHEQGRYKEYHDMVLEKQLGENKGVFTDDLLISLGKDLGLDIKNCVKAFKYRRQISAELKEAKDLGIRGTPALFINGKLINNPGSYLAMKQLLDEELKKVK
jgi:protein-disulfide isomerase